MVGTTKETMHGIEEWVGAEQKVPPPHHILKKLKSQQHNIVQMFAFGDDGQVLKPSGRVISDLIYIVMENVQGGLLFDLC